MIKLIFAAAASLSLATPAAAVTIINGSFEQSSVNPGASRLITGKPADATVITGWTVADTRGGIDYVGTLWAAQDGSRSLDLSGTGRGAIYQDVATVVGGMYRVAFYMAGNPGSNSNKKLVVSIGGADADSFEFQNSAATTSTNMRWTRHTYDFMAENAVSRLTFAASGGATTDPFGPALDNVSITAVPEPATWGMMLMGLGMVGYGLRRRARRPAVAVRFA